MFNTEQLRIPYKDRQHIFFGTGETGRKGSVTIQEKNKKASRDA